MHCIDVLHKSSYILTYIPTPIPSTLLEVRIPLIFLYLGNPECLSVLPFRRTWLALLLPPPDLPRHLHHRDLQSLQALRYL